MAHVYNSQLDAFDLYHQVHDSYYSRPPTSVLGGPDLPALGHALAGSTGAAISNISTYPLALIITRLQLQKQLRLTNTANLPDEYTSIRDAAHKIYKKGGLKALYAGLTSDTFKTIADSFLFFLAYNFLRQSRLRSRKDRASHLPVLDELSVGFIAGAFAKFWTTPIANIVTRKQACAMMTQQYVRQIECRGGSASSIARQIRLEKGLQGFWSGYSASLILTLNPSLTFFFFESFKRVFVPRSQTSSPPASTTFLLAACSKAMASAITYPFSLAKTRAQMSSRSVDQDTVVDDKEEHGAVSAPMNGQVKSSSNVFAIIFGIIRADGLSALYEGLTGEIMKGFFSHGITMFIKDMIHHNIIQLHYLISRLLKRYPDAQIPGKETLADAAELSNTAMENAKAVAKASKEQILSQMQEGQSTIKKQVP